MERNDSSIGRLGFIGLGRMGEAMVLRLLERGVDVVVFNRTKEKIDEVVGRWSLVVGQKKKSKDQSLKTKDQVAGELMPAHTIEELVQTLTPPRVIWLMIPEGKPVDEMILKLQDAGIQAGDTVIDGGNSFYKDSIRRYESLSKRNIQYLDVGTSGGIEGARSGACLMIGGEKAAYERLVPIFEAAAMKDGYAYFGSAGAGHFVKMVHNGVEYGMLQAIGEGFELLEKGPYKLDLHNVTRNWNHGSVVRGWLMELLERALKSDDTLSSIEGIVGGGKTGYWTLNTAKEFNIAVPALESALDARKKTQDIPTFAGKIIAALRNQFGGHEVKKT